MTVGIQQDYDFGLQDSGFVNNIASQNNACQTLTAFAGGGQASAKQMAPAAAFINIGTVATAGDSVKLPFAVKGQSFLVFNSTATSANVFGQAATNKASNTVDTINGTIGSTAYAIAAGVSVHFFAPANGIWAALKSA